jgi:hypothetical protein
MRSTGASFRSASPIAIGLAVKDRDGYEMSIAPTPAQLRARIACA